MLLGGNQGVQERFLSRIFAEESDKKAKLNDSFSLGFLFFGLNRFWREGLQDGGHFRRKFPETAAGNDRIQ